MTKSTITREQLIKKAQEQIEFCRHTKITGEGRAHVNQCAALFEIALAAMDREHVRNEHAEWSQATFGNVGPVGPLKHLSKEALEAAAEPGDLSEWADMQFLLWDAQRRAGITDEQITQAMIDKLAVNKQREWQEPKDGEPRLHIKEQPAPVVPDFKKLARELVDNLVDCGGLDEGVKEKYLEWAEKTCRAAMLHAGNSPAKNGVAPAQSGNSPAIPDGYVLVSKEARKEILDEFDSIIDYGAEDSVDAWHRLLAAATQEVKP